MVKQKSGLGRGLNALFDEVDTNPTIKKTSSITKEENKTTQPQSTFSVQETNKTTSTYMGGVIGSVINHQQPKKEEKKETKASSSIYFSEDALENAKVVEREARKTPTFRTTPEQKRKTAEIQAEQKKSTASSVLSGNSVSIQETPKPEKVEKKDEKGTVGEVELSKVQPNPDQPRTHFKPEEIEELANSIKKEGLLQPILVNKAGDHYQIIAGERRWQACKSLDMKTIPVRFWTADNDKALELALIENIQRSDLNPIEEAYGYKRLMERKGMTQSEVAQTVSKGRSTIANALRLLDLPEEAQQLLFEEKISAGHARAILSIPTPEGRKTLTNKLVNEKLSVRETESIARLLSGRDKSKEAGTSKRLPTPASFKKAARSLSKFLSAPVRVKTVQGKNKIEIQFQDEEELERILNAIAERE